MPESQVSMSNKRASDDSRATDRGGGAMAARANALLAATRMLVDVSDFQEAMPSLLKTICSQLGWDVGEVWWRDVEQDQVTRIGLWHVSDLSASAFVDADEPVYLPRDVGLPGKVWHTGRSAWSQDVASVTDFARAEAAAAAGLKSALALPISLGGEALGVLAFFARDERVPDQNLIDMMEILGVQIGQVYERLRAADDLRQRVNQQRALAELGRVALTEIPSRELADQAVACVAEVLGAEYCKVLELSPDGNSLLMISGVGWSDGVVGSASVPSGTDSQAGYTLESRSPVIVEDLATETRFSGPRLLTDHGVVSGMSTTISTVDGAYGVLGAHSRHRRLFTLDDINFLESVANILATVVQREGDESRLGESERQYSELVSSLGVAVYTTDADGVITFFNESAVNLWGRDPELGVDKWCGSWRIYDGSGQPISHDECPMAVTLRENRRVEGVEIIVETPNGERRNVLPYPAPLRDADGILVGAVNVLIDVTHRRSTERALEVSEERLRVAMDAGSMGAWEWDIGSGKVTWSATLEAMHGLPEGGFDGTFEGYTRDIHPDDLERVKATVDESLAGKPHQLTYRIIRPDGEVRWLSARGELLRGANGRPSRLVGVCSDVTEQRAADERTAYLAAIVESTQDAVIGKTLDGIVTSWNHGAEEMYGYLADEMTGKHISTIMPSNRRRESREIMERIRNVEKVDHYETVRQHKDGHLIETSVTISPIRDANGKVIGASAINRDITALKRQEQFLSLMAQASEALAASLQDREMMMAAVGRLMVPGIADWCSVDLRDEKGEITCAAVIHDDPKKVETILELRRQYPIDPDGAHAVPGVIRSGKTEVAFHVTESLIEELVEDKSLQRALKELGLRSAICVPIVARGQTLGAITMATAESERYFDEHTAAFAEELGRRIGLALDNANLVQNLARSLDSKDEFLGLMSHELRTPITAIYGGARLLRTRDGGLDADNRRQVLADIENESERMFRMVENLLALSRVELGERPPSEPVLVQRIVAKVAASHRERNPHREIEIGTSGDLPPVEAQATYVEQVVRNVLSNAEKYTPKDGPIVVDGAVEDGSVVVSITDSGPGIEENEASMLFERFYRANGNSQRIRGLGLGLTVCKRLVEAMGGTISAEPQEPNGLRITFALPICGEEKE